MTTEEMRRRNRLHLRAAHALQAMIRIDECLQVHGEVWFREAQPDAQLNGLAEMRKVEDLTFVALAQLSLADRVPGGAR